MCVFFFSAKRLGLKWPEEEDLDLNPKHGITTPRYKTEKEKKAGLKMWRTHVHKRKRRIPNERNFLQGFWREVVSQEKIVYVLMANVFENNRD